MNRSRQEKTSRAGLTEGQASQPWPVHSNVMSTTVQLSIGVLSCQANSSEGMPASDLRTPIFALHEPL